MGNLSCLHGQGEEGGTFWAYVSLPMTARGVVVLLVVLLPKPARLTYIMTACKAWIRQREYQGQGLLLNIAASERARRGAVI